MALTYLRNDGRIFGYIESSPLGITRFWWDITGTLDRRPIAQIVESHGKLYCRTTDGTVLRADQTLRNTAFTTDYASLDPAYDHPVWVEQRAGVSAFGVRVAMGIESIYCVTTSQTLVRRDRPVGSTAAATETEVAPGKRVAAVAVGHALYFLDADGHAFSVDYATQQLQALGTQTFASLIPNASRVLGIGKDDGAYDLDANGRWQRVNPSLTVAQAAKGLLAREVYLLGKVSQAVYQRDPSAPPAGQAWIALGAEKAAFIAASDKALYRIDAGNRRVYLYTGDHQGTHTWRDMGANEAQAVLAVDA